MTSQDREEQNAVIEPASDDAGYAHAVTAHMAPSHCSICGRALVDADSVQRGYGPICAEKYMRPMRATGPLSPALLAKAHEMAPERLRKRLLAVAPLRDWEDPDVRHKLVNVAVYHASIATSYGDSAKSIQENGIDISHVVVAAVQTLVRGAGYDQLAERLITTHAKENQQRRQGRETDEGYGKGEADITIEFTDGTQRMMRLATPFSESFNAAARKAGLFPKFEKVGRTFWRLFKTEDINKVVNLVTSVFGDVIALGPDRTLAPLPAMPMFITPPKTPTPPPPKVETGPEPVVVPVEIQEIIGRGRMAWDFNGRSKRYEPGDYRRHQRALPSWASGRAHHGHSVGQRAHAHGSVGRAVLGTRVAPGGTRPTVAQFVTPVPRTRGMTLCEA